MTSLFQKASLLASSILHGGMDHEIKEHRTDVVRQEVRRLEDGSDQLKDELAVNEGTVADLTAQIKDLQDKIRETTSNMQLLLGDGDPSNDGEAQKMGGDIIDLQDQLAEKQRELTDAQASVDQLRQTADAVTGKHRQMLDQVHTLESADHIAEAKNSAAAAIKSVAGMMGGSVDGSVDDVAEGIHRDAAIANARLKDAMADIGTTGADAVRQARIKALMANQASALTTALQGKAANANQPAAA